MSFTVGGAEQRLPTAQRAAFLVQDEEGRVLVFEFKTSGGGIVVELEHEYDDFAYMTAGAAPEPVTTRATISGELGRSFPLGDWWWPTPDYGQLNQERRELGDGG